MCVYMYIWFYVHVYVYMYTLIYVCIMYVCIYVCMYVFVNARCNIAPLHQLGFRHSNVTVNKTIPPSHPVSGEYRLGYKTNEI